MSYYSVVMHDGPIRYLRLNDASGSTAVDSSSSAQNGTINGTVLYRDTGLIKDVGKSMGFVAANSAYVSIPTTGLPTGANPWTLEAWISLFSVPTSGFYEIINFGTGSTNQSPQLYVHSSQFWLSVWSNGISAGSPQTSTTYHIVGTYDGATARLYVNGSQIASGALSANVSLSWSNIGADSNNEDFMDGNIQEAAIYSKVLTADQVRWHYNAGIAGQIMRQRSRTFAQLV